MREENSSDSIETLSSRFSRDRFKPTEIPAKKKSFMVLPFGSSSMKNLLRFDGFFCFRPYDELVFERADSAAAASTTDSIQTLILTNVGDKILTFKIKTTSPEKFRVKPGCSQLQPGASATVSVYLLKGRSTSFLFSFSLLHRRNVQPIVRRLVWSTKRNFSLFGPWSDKNSNNNNWSNSGKRCRVLYSMNIGEIRRKMSRAKTSHFLSF